MKFHIWIIGCQYNEWDGARLGFLMQKLGFVESELDNADVILVLACSVRQTAIDRILGRVKNWRTAEMRHGNHAELVQKKKDPLILVTGCVLDTDKEKFAKKGILFFESGDFKQLAKLLSKSFKINIPKSYKPTANSCFVPIMVGCNNFCSYCAVPYTRGREKSRPMDEVVADVKELIKHGHKEIMLLGQNVNSYKNPARSVIPEPEGSLGLGSIGDPENIDSHFHGNDKPKTNFTVLLEKLNDLDGDFVISFTSNHPKDMTDDIIEAVAILPKIKKEIHLPLQSGSDKILKLMNRPYLVKQYLDLIENCKLKIENLVLTTDVIVGFPGEIEDDFQKTVEIMKQVDYDVAYINKYSPRAGTAAFKLGDPISWQEKKRRWKILDDIVYKK